MGTMQPRFKTVVVGVGDFFVSREPRDRLVTYSLGSCVGVAAYDPKAGVGGLLHFMLPDSLLNQEKAGAQPALFGDTGLAAFLKELFSRGASRPYLEVKLAGGAKSLRTPSDLFNIGERNLILAKRFLWKNGLIVSAEDTGGNEYRTLSLEMESGRVQIKDPRGTFEL